LRLLFLEGPLTRGELGQSTGLSSGSVTGLTSALLEEGLIVEAGQEESEGGRPRMMLRVNPEFGALIGVEVGETGIKIEGFDLRLRMAGATDVGLHPQRHEPETAIDEIVRGIEKLVAQFEVEGRHLLGVGIGVPGLVEHRPDGARVHAPNIGWNDVALERLIRERVETPIFVENGAKAQGQAEMWLGAGRGTHHAVVALWGTGVGAAIFTDGSLYRGASSSAGEWGHTCISVGGHPCRCGSRGCLEAYIGAEGLLSEWRRSDPTVAACDPDEEEWANRLLEAAKTNSVASRVLDDAAIAFGVAAANLANLFNPELIVIGGWLGLKLGRPLLSRINEVIRDQALDYTASRVRVELARFGTDAVAMGASTLVIDALLNNGGVPPSTSGGRLRRLALL
jgi:predicted NBD/HSP70 family sugar kinase